MEVLANVARYHRRPPRRKHTAFAALPRAERRAVEVLSALLRLADSLDRRPVEIETGGDVRHPRHHVVAVMA